MDRKIIEDFNSVKISHSKNIGEQDIFLPAILLKLNKKSNKI